APDLCDDGSSGTRVYSHVGTVVLGGWCGNHQELDSLRTRVHKAVRQAGRNMNTFARPEGNHAVVKLQQRASLQDEEVLPRPGVKVSDLPPTRRNALVNDAEVRMLEK